MCTECRSYLKIYYLCYFAPVGLRVCLFVYSIKSLSLSFSHSRFSLSLIENLIHWSCCRCSKRNPKNGYYCYCLKIIYDIFVLYAEIGICLNVEVQRGEMCLPVCCMSAYSIIAFARMQKMDNSPDVCVCVYIYGFTRKLEHTINYYDCIFCSVRCIKR